MDVFENSERPFLKENSDFHHEFMRNKKTCEIDMGNMSSIQSIKHGFATQIS